MYFSVEMKAMDLRNQFYRSSVGESDIESTEHTLSVNCAGSVLSDDGFCNGKVRRDYYLIYVTDGEFSITLHNKTEVIKKGMAVVIKPGTQFFYRSEKGTLTEYLWIHFTGADVEGVLGGLKISTDELLKVGVHMTMRELWKRLYREFIVSDSAFDITSGSILAYILSNIGRYISPSGSRLIKSVEYINTHYNSDIKISELAKNENMSEWAFRKHFYAVTGSRPSEYIQRVRVNAATALLENTDKKLSEIAALSGFYDEYYFGRVFKKSVGVTPGTYRKMIKGR